MLKPNLTSGIIPDDCVILKKITIAEQMFLFLLIKVKMTKPDINYTSMYKGYVSMCK